ncbi:hypothetical protein R1sor_004174 [Riccia sorocarpa]|uniref:Hexosyltransferase n=1 Tax=Riccia sorocarpa TaxID=122646 RepID=A0ABD3H6J8_9MARC
MPLRRGGSVIGSAQRIRSIRCRSSVLVLLAVTVIAPLVYWTGTVSNFSASVSHRKTFIEQDPSSGYEAEYRRLQALKHIENLFPKEVLEVIYSKTEGTGSLDFNSARKNLASALVQEEKTEERAGGQDKSVIPDQGEAGNQEQGGDDIKVTLAEVEAEVGGRSVDLSVTEDDSAKQVRKRSRELRQEQRSKDLSRQDENEEKKAESEAIERAKTVVDDETDGRFSIWKREDPENPDLMVRLMRDQLIMARAYASIAESSNNGRLLRDLRLKIKENVKLLGEANVDSELPAGIKDKVKQMARLLTRARDQHRDCAMMVKKLRAMLQTSEEHARTLKKQSTFLSQLAAKTIPKGLHCLSMSLTLDYHLRPPEDRNFPQSPKLEDPTLYHYALFSDNILAAAVVVNSTLAHTKEPEKHVFHVVTDRMNFGAMKEWFLENPPGRATIQVENVDDYKWLNASYCPVLAQLSSASMKDYYFKADTGSSLATVSANLKYRNPKYLSMLNHLRFYLPEVFPKLNKVLFLDDDVVVQKDLSGLWNVDLQGNVNGAVETCGPSFHRFDKYLNFSHPEIARNFDPMACGWAYGMNMFDLVEWKKRDITGIYHKWQRMNEDRTLWKLGTLPPGLITFYNLTQPLDKSWHVLGLGYNPGVLHSELASAAVVHYNGNMKPWLEIGMSRYKPYWTKYVKYDHPALQQCNINE